MSDDYLNAELGKEHKDKLREIAEDQERNMTGQLRVMISDFYDKLGLNSDKKTTDGDLE